MRITKNKRPCNFWPLSITFNTQAQRPTSYQTKVGLAVLSEAKMERSTKTRLVCMALPFQGHINSMLHLAKVLHFKGFFITFVNTEYAHQQLLKHDGSLSAHAGLPDFRFASISDGLSPPHDSDEYREDIRNIIPAHQKNCPASFLGLISAFRTIRAPVCHPLDV